MVVVKMMIIIAAYINSITSQLICFAITISLPNTFSSAANSLTCTLTQTYNNMGEQQIWQMYIVQISSLNFYVTEIFLYYCFCVSCFHGWNFV